VDGKFGRVLRWQARQVSKGNTGMIADTKAGYYEAWANGKAFKGCQLLHHDGPRDLNSAIAACEADYIERCSEFLRVAGPGECVVKVADILAVERALNKYRTAEENSGKPYPRTPDWMFPLRGLTAAIDAARKEGGE